MMSAENAREFELLAAAFRLAFEVQRRRLKDPEQLAFLADSWQACEEAIEKRHLAALRATYPDLKGQVEDARWGPEFLQEFAARHGISFFDIRGKKGPDARLAKILARGKIATPAELRVAKDRLDVIADEAPHADEEQRLHRMIDEYEASQEK